MKTAFGILIGIVFTLSLLMALTVWKTQKTMNQIDTYIGTAIQKGIFPTEAMVKSYQPQTTAPTAEKK